MEVKIVDDMKGIELGEDDAAVVIRNPSEVIAYLPNKEGVNLEPAMLVTVLITLLDDSNRDLFDKLHYRFMKHMEALRKEKRNEVHRPSSD